MERKIKLLGAITVLLASVACIPFTSATYAQNIPYVDIFEAKYALAYYSNVDGCIFREIWIFPAKELYINPPFYGYKMPTLDVSIQYGNGCTGEEIAGSAYLTIGSSDFELRNDFTAATLETTATLEDYFTGDNIELDISMTWAETSPKQHFNFNNMFTNGNCRVMRRSGDTIRSATVSGSVMYNGTNLIGGPTEGAEMGVLRTGMVVNSLPCF